MWEWFNRVPSEYCCLILPRIVWPMAVADIAIAVSYFAIGGWMFAVSLRHTPYGKLIQGGRLLLGMFILLCGLGHLMDVIKVWTPICDWLVIERLATATVSVVTWLWAWKHKADLLRIFGVKR